MFVFRKDVSFKGIALCLLVAYCAGVQSLNAAPGRAPSVRLTDALEWLYADSQVESVPSFGNVDVPSNGVAEVNLLFNRLDPRAPLSFSCDVPGAEWFRLVGVPVSKNTGPAGFVESAGVTNVFVSRDAPFCVFDAMEPLSSGRVIPGSDTAALRLRLRSFPQGCAAFPVRIFVSQGAFRRQLEFSVAVHGVAVPPVSPASFKYTNWMDWYEAMGCHGVRSYWTPQHWDLIRRYVRLAVYGRQNMVMVPLFFKTDSAGKRVLDEERFVEFVSLLDSEGVAYLEGPHLCRFMDGSWTSKNFRTVIGTNATTSVEGAAELAFLASSLAGIIERNGWRERWYQHVSDEPAAHNAAEYRITAGIIRKHMPGIRLVDAIEFPDLPGALDVYCPKNHDYEQNRNRYERLRMGPTDEIWCYTCCYPGGKWMNRLLDHEILRSVYLPWGCFIHSLDGYLHWGFNRWTPDSDPFTPGFGGTLPPGDTHLVYPGGSDGPWPSVRFEAMRQGMEDLELLRLLRQRAPEKAERISHRLVRGFGDYELDVRLYRRVRRALLAAVAEIERSDRK